MLRLLHYLTGKIMSIKTTLEEVMFDMYDQSYSRRLPPEFRSWKEFHEEQAEKLWGIIISLYPEEKEGGEA